MTKGHKKIRRQRVKWIISLTALMVGVGMVFAWSSNRAIGLGYEISNLQAERRAVLEDYSRLRVELASLRRPERVERIAVDKFGLTRPPVERVVVIE